MSKNKIAFQVLEKLFKNTKGNVSFEIAFMVSETPKFYECCMGKLQNQETKEDVYWFGLTPDGKNAYDYKTFEEMKSVKFFDGKNLEEIWEKIQVLSIDGCNPYDEILQNLLK